MIAFNLQITNWIFYYIPSFERSKILLTVFLRCKDNCTIKIFFSFFFFFIFPLTTKTNGTKNGGNWYYTPFAKKKKNLSLYYINKGFWGFFGQEKWPKR
ncbi:hypothetical protein B5C39_00760 [Mesomycoplasma hyopneumoniae]|nr:hypothetical protein B5C39_00760 [Mesomycoplasma hyopneumoniae]